MSDFIFSQRKLENGILTSKFNCIFKNEVNVQEFHGEWGSLAITEDLYKGFQCYESNEYICFVAGGPILNFDTDSSLGTKEYNEKSELICRRIINGTMCWHNDLSGPFSILLVNKLTTEVVCVTDIISYIPIYSVEDRDSVILSTHIDLLALVAEKQSEIDVVSEVDFILNGIVTYPYTSYMGIKQISPASEHRVTSKTKKVISESYWLPYETNKYNSISEAAKDVRKALQDYVNKSVINQPKVAHFISGGEDSRIIAGLLPKDIIRDSYVFLDSMNREGQVAKKTANAYGSNFNLETRSQIYYIDILPEATSIVGKGSSYTHGHTLGFVEDSSLNKYEAVFGGLYSDSLLKGLCIKKHSLSKRFPFFPEIKKQEESYIDAINNEAFKPKVLELLTERKQSHLEYIRSIRPNSAGEWFHLWPISMNENTPNIHVNRRLFQSREPFLANEIVKISASIPQEWKMNRRLFQKAAKPIFKPTKFLFHADGRLPYFPWYINSVIQSIVWSNRKVFSKLGFIKGNQGPWGQWTKIMKSDEWNKMIYDYSNGIEPISNVLKVDGLEELFKGHDLTRKQKINLLQTIYSNSRIMSYKDN